MCAVVCFGCCRNSQRNSDPYTPGSNKKNLLGRGSRKGSSSGDYAMVMSNGDVIDGEDAKISGHVRYINHSLRKKNCRAAELNQGPLCIILVEATRAVAAGSEFFLDYGAVYWDNQGFTRFTPQRLVIDYW